MLRFFANLGFLWTKLDLLSALYKAEKKGNKIVEIPYVHPIDIEGNSKSFPNLPRFLLLGFFYLWRLIQAIFRR